MTRRGAFCAGAVAIAIAGLGACTPTIDVKVEPINIYAKLDANVRIRLDKEVQSAIQQNPNLF
ncbi:MAG TPA: YnbE family lipoprotein [Caulobacteraceae bacterium]|nr:YnbE family lipoprotein [Caulobacteraceae bacterium]